MTLPGAPPPRGAPAPPADHTAGITSPHSGDRLDAIRTAILSLQMYAEGETDDVELATVQKCILAFLDHVRTSIFALQLASELTRDETKIREVREVIKQLQTLLTNTRAAETQRSA